MYGNFENDGSTEAFDLKEMHRDRTKTAASAFETGNEISSAYAASTIHSVSSNAPPISEIWLNVCVQGQVVRTNERALFVMCIVLL